MLNRSRRFYSLLIASAALLCLSVAALSMYRVRAEKQRHFALPAATEAAFKHGQKAFDGGNSMAAVAAYQEAVLLADSTALVAAGRRSQGHAERRPRQAAGVAGPSRQVVLDQGDVAAQPRVRAGGGGRQPDR